MLRQDDARRLSLDILARRRSVKRQSTMQSSLIPSNPRALVQIHGPLPRGTVTSSRAAEESRAQAVPFLTPVAPGLDEESVRDMDGLLFALQPVFKKSTETKKSAPSDPVGF
jgi:hypothetical protein